MFFRPLKCLSGAVTSKETAVPKQQCFEGRGANPRNKSFDIFLQTSNFLGLVTVNLLDFWESCDTHRETGGLFLENPQKLLGSEKSFVKLRHAYSVKLVFSYEVKGIKIKITAKFRASRRLRFEDTKPEKELSPEILPKRFTFLSASFSWHKVNSSQYY